MKQCLLFFALSLFGLSTASAAAAQQSWLGYAGNPQHTALSGVAAQSMDSILWQTPVDLNPQYSGSDLYIHYGEPMATAANTILVPVKTGATDGFKIEARSGADGTLKWTQTTDYTLPPVTGWTPSFPAALTPPLPAAPAGRLYFAGAGGTVYFINNPDASGMAVSGQFAFYGLGNYQAQPAAYNAAIQIDSPITSDAAGNIYFGFYASSGNGLGLSSGIARIAPDGTGAWVSAQSAAGGDAAITKTVYNCAPALSNNGAFIYAAVNGASSFSAGYLLQLNAATLATAGSVALYDPSGARSYLPDDGTASPMVGPDGDVYFGVFDSPFGSNSEHGWLLHFSGDLSLQKTTGAFGWDDTASVVPVSMVPSYAGASPYLLMTKYNNYAGIGTGNGINKLAVLDPNATQIDASTGHTVMKEVLTIAGVTPDPAYTPQFPSAVREWCINSAVVDPATGSIYAGSEDGKLYKWCLAMNAFEQVVTLTPGVGEAYTPTLIGPNGVIYAINNATLFAVGSPPPVFQNGAPPASTAGANYSFAFAAAGSPAPVYSLLAGAFPDGLSLDANSGALTGIPTVPGVFTGTVSASNTSGSATQNFSITINPPIAITPDSLPNGTVYILYAQTLLASGGTGAKTFAVNQGTLPPELMLNADTGELSGNPTAMGAYNFTIQASDAVGASSQKKYAVTISPPTIVVSPGSLPDARTGAPYSQKLTASGGKAPYLFTMKIGSLPPGLTLANDGTIRGTPTQEGLFKFWITATDSSSDREPYFADMAYTIFVDRIPLFASGPEATPNPAVVDLAVTFTAAADLADAVVTWDFGDGSPGLSGAVVQHIYSAEGDFLVTVTLRNPRTNATQSAILALHVGHDTLLPGTLPLRRISGVLKLDTRTVDSVTVDCQLLLPNVPSIHGLALGFNIGGIARSVVLDPHGKALLPGGEAQVRLVSRTQAGAVVKVFVKLSGSLKADLVSGTAIDARGLPLKMLVTVVLGGMQYSAVVPLQFKQTPGGNIARY